jgi:hypothetical protein
MWKWRHNPRIHKLRHFYAPVATSQSVSRCPPDQQACPQCGLHVAENRIISAPTRNLWAGQLSRYSDWLWAGRSEDRIPVGRDFPPVQTGPGAHPAACTMGTGSFPGVKYSGACTTQPLLVPWSWQSRAIHLPTLCATTGPVTGTLYLQGIEPRFFDSPVRRTVHITTFIAINKPKRFWCP